MKAQTEIIIRWIRKKVKAAKAKGAILGLSGGVDSAVVASLVKKALGDKHLVLMMPHQKNNGSLEDAELLIKHFKLKSKTVDLEPVIKSLSKVLPGGNKLALANIKPRLRMLVLYYFANSMNYLVVGTGNKSELSVGYFTKYGDGGVDILPIADLLKSQVRKLAEELGIPKKIIDKAPSADLWPGQTDEEEMGVIYNELDCILSCMEKGKKCPVSKDKIKKVRTMIKASEHKRCMPEICKI